MAVNPYQLSANYLQLQADKSRQWEANQQMSNIHIYLVSSVLSTRFGPTAQLWSNGLEHETL